MGVYIKGMEMPTNCAQCACCDDDARYCQAAHKYIPMIGKPKFCPLVEVKEPHGRLIDEDEVLDTVKRLKSLPWGDDSGNRVPLLFEPYEVEQVIKQSPTVIEGSR